jgi:hypothetical protein
LFLSGSYQLSTMSYHSSLGGTREKIKKDEKIEMPQLTGGITQDQVGIAIEKGKIFTTNSRLIGYRGK